MAQGRIRIGLIYTYDPRWMAGAYYIANLVAALNLVEDETKPHLSILSFDAEGHELIRAINYPYISFVSLDFKLSFSKRVVNKLSRLCIGKNIFLSRFSDSDFLAVFPYIDVESLKSIRHKISWIPDFQSVFLPEFFSQSELDNRNNLYSTLAKQTHPIVFSSEDAKSHFVQLFPEAKTPLFVLNFAVTHPDYSTLDSVSILNKYGLKGSYFFSPNQFWIHKNQQVIIEALRLLKEQGNTSIQVAFSGKENDYRFPDYAKGLRKKVQDYGLENQVHFLGFIDRAEQLLIMNHCLAVIQPSLFEGWSTVIEDAKAMSKFVIASDLKVNREQLDENAMFFDPHDPAVLAEMLMQYSTSPRQAVKLNYAINKIKFASELIHMLQRIISL